MQRLHQEDLVGEVLERGERWKVLSLSAIAQRDESYPYEMLFEQESFERKAGAALHPERDSVETLLRIKETIGEYNFQSQYQQEPTPREGGLIKRDWLKFYEKVRLPRQFDYILQSWDTASKCGEMNDYSVCTTWALTNSQFYLLDVFRRRCDFPTLKRSVLDLYKKFSPCKVLIEDRSSGTSLIQELQWEGVYGIEAYSPRPGSDKIMRLADQSIKFEGGRVYLPLEAPWLDDYIREITGFPGTRYDDQADSTTQALDILGPMVPVLAPLPDLFIPPCNYVSSYGSVPGRMPRALLGWD